MKELKTYKNTFVRRIKKIFLLFIIGETFLWLGNWYGKSVDGTPKYFFLIHIGYFLIISVYGYTRIYHPYQTVMKKFYEECREVQLLATDAELDNIFPEICILKEKCQKFLDERNILIQDNVAKYLSLQNQINPHFLYNALESIRGDMLEEGNSDVAETLEALSMFFRYSVSGTGKMVSLEDELENIEYYWIIQKYRFENNIRLEVKNNENCPQILKLPIPKLILQPIVENAIFHGLERKIGGGNITIQIEITQTRLLINIVDDGKGIPEHILVKLNKALKNALKEERTSIPKDDYKGVALLNIAKRIQILYGVQYGVHIFSRIDYGTCVRLTLPFEQTQGERLW